MPNPTTHLLQQASQPLIVQLPCIALRQQAAVDGHDLAHGAAGEGSIVGPGKQGSIVGPGKQGSVVGPGKQGRWGGREGARRVRHGWRCKSVTRAQKRRLSHSCPNSKTSAFFSRCLRHSQAKDEDVGGGRCAKGRGCLWVGAAEQIEEETRVVRDLGEQAVSKQVNTVEAASGCWHCSCGHTQVRQAHLRRPQAVSVEATVPSTTRRACRSGHGGQTSSAKYRVQPAAKPHGKCVCSLRYGCGRALSTGGCTPGRDQAMPNRCYNPAAPTSEEHLQLHGGDEHAAPVGQELLWRLLAAGAGNVQPQHRELKAPDEWQEYVAKPACGQQGRIMPHASLHYCPLSASCRCGVDGWLPACPLTTASLSTADQNATCPHSRIVIIRNWVPGAAKERTALPHARRSHSGQGGSGG